MMTLGGSFVAASVGGSSTDVQLTMGGGVLVLIGGYSLYASRRKNKSAKLFGKGKALHEPYQERCALHRERIQREARETRHAGAISLPMRVLRCARYRFRRQDGVVGEESLVLVGANSDFVGQVWGVG